MPETSALPVPPSHPTTGATAHSTTGATHPTTAHSTTSATHPTTWFTGHPALELHHR
jgi:hypothetical protein